MKTVPLLVVLLPVVFAETHLFNPYERAKNGPPLTNVFHKVRPAWIRTKIRAPKHHPSARMPEFGFTDDEVLDIMAYLKSIADPSPVGVPWPTWADKAFEEMTDEESAKMLEVTERGKAVWGQARCTVCHVVNGPEGKPIGGFVDLRVGGRDLQFAGARLHRDWLYRWIQEPKAYHADTLMPRTRFSDEEIRALVEFILRDDAFQPAAPPAEEPARFDDPTRVEPGRRLIAINRCVVCHDVRGIPEVLSLPARKPIPREGTFERLAYDARCLTCHAIAGRGGTYAPDLTAAGSRLKGDWIRKFVRQPDLLRPLSQQMPKFNLSDDEARIAMDFFQSQDRDGRVPPEAPGGPFTDGEIGRGRELFRSKRCAACHAAGEGTGGVVGPDLGAVGDRLRPGYLWFHLKEPHGANRTSAEPNLGLSDEEARALAAFLSARKK